MEIRFETVVAEENDFKTSLLLSKIDNGVFFEITTSSDTSYQTNQIHFSDKEQLSEIIGVLLHLQSKLKK